jgi:hypothetical protein
LFSSIGLWLGYLLTRPYVELLDLGIEIIEDGYSVGNTKYDVGTLRFKDFIRMVNFF